MTLDQGPEFLQTLSRGPFASKFSPRATQGQITSYCETRRVLVPPASTCRSSYIIFIIIVLLDPEHKGPNCITNPTGYWPCLLNKGATTVRSADRTRIVHDCEKDLMRVSRSVRGRQQISVERSWHHLNRHKLPSKLLFRKRGCGTIKRLLFTAVTHNTSPPHSHSERQQTDTRLSKPSHKFHQSVTLPFRDGKRG